MGTRNLMSLQEQIQSLLDARIKSFVHALSPDPKLRSKMLALWKSSSENMIAFCPHVMRSGPRVGRLCGKVAAKNSPLGYCRDHFVSADTPDSKPINATAQTLDRVEITLQKMLGPALVDPQTKLAFNKQKLAIGKEVNGEIVPLTAEDIEFCAFQKIATASE